MRKCLYECDRWTAHSLAGCATGRPLSGWETGGELSRWHTVQPLRWGGIDCWFDVLLPRRCPWPACTTTTWLDDGGADLHLLGCLLCHACVTGSRLTLLCPPTSQYSASFFQIDSLFIGHSLLSGNKYGISCQNRPSLCSAAASLRHPSITLTPRSRYTGRCSTRRVACQSRSAGNSPSSGHISTGQQGTQAVRVQQGSHEPAL